MIHTLTPYPAYKDSGVPWLGDVPAHWEIRSLGSLATARSTRNRTDLPLLSVVREKGVILRSSMKADENHNFIPDDLSNYKVVYEGDLVINKMKAWQGSLGVSAYDGIVSPAYYVFEFQLGDAKYGHMLLRSRIYVDFFGQLSDGVRIGQWDLSIDGMKRIPVVIPPKEEQSAIVRYLDYMDRRIRRYIHAKQKLIKLLEEQKQAIIHRAVTHGLDPDVRLKDSGVEWMGNVPEHWEVVKLGFKFRCTSGSTPSRSTSDYFGGNIPWVKTGELIDSEIHETQERITSLAVELHSLKLLPVDTLLIAMYGQGQTRGRTGLLKIEATTNQACLAILPNPRVAYPKYLQCWFISQYSQLRQISESRNTTQPNLNGQMIKDQCLLLPPLLEQASLIKAIQHDTQQINVIINCTHRDIALLREYRTRLISDVVTGKLDVRGAAASLSLEIEDESEENTDLEFEELPENMDEDELCTSN